MLISMMIFSGDGRSLKNINKIIIFRKTIYEKNTISDQISHKILRFISLPTLVITVRSLDVS